MGVDKIVALGHSGFDVDRDVAYRVGGVDVVIGGHSNTFLYTGKQGPLLLFLLLPSFFLLCLLWLLFFIFYPLPFPPLSFPPISLL